MTSVHNRLHLRCTLPLLLLAVTLSGCGQTPDKSGRLLSMAAQEAAGIPNVLDRFTRQLNIADTQLRTERKTDAAATLALCRDTLAASTRSDFDDFHRIAGWTAISQLARQAGDRDLAVKSSDLALAALNDVQPPAQRPQYVMSLAGELADLRGKESAIELLDSGAGWAVELPDAATRRQVLVMFTRALLDYDAFENARNTMRRDPDVAWRTDTLLALSDDYAVKARHVQSDSSAAARSPSPQVQAEAGEAMAATGLGGRKETAPAAAAPQSMGGFNQDVRFENVFKRNR
jgi:hypothetical protein